MWASCLCVCLCCVNDDLHYIVLSKRDATSTVTIDGGDGENPIAVQKQ